MPAAVSAFLNSPGERLYAQFTAVGATREVMPDIEEKRYLRWLLGGPQPPGLDAIRDAVDHDVGDDVEREASN